MFNDPWNNKKPFGNDKGVKNEYDLNFALMKFNNLLNSFFFGKDKSPFFRMLSLLVVFICFLGFYIATGFSVINQDEEGVKLFLGQYSETVGPGLRYNFPYPVGKTVKVKVKTINREEIGSKFYSDVSDRGEGVMLTGDENIVNINFDVQWRISNAYNYLFKLRDRQIGFTVKNAAESAMREVIGKSTISFAIEGKGRAVIAADTRISLQRILDNYQMGVEILSIQLKKVDPPEKVISAFRDVQSARADREKFINEGYAYANQIVPKAKGEAIKIVNDAEARKEEIVSLADGNAQRFLALYNEYKNYPDSVRNRLYIETMEEILGSMDKIIVSDDLKGILPYLPLGDLKK